MIPAKAIAKTILDQLGGDRFISMTGARNFSYAPDGSLSFRLPNMPGVPVNNVRISLDPTDTYNVEFGRVRGIDYKVVRTEEMVYADSLRRVFESNTGLYTSL